MATQVSQGEINAAIQSIAHAVGSLMLGIKALDHEDSNDNDAWAGSEAIHGAIRLLESSYCTLNGAGALRATEA